MVVYMFSQILISKSALVHNARAYRRACLQRQQAGLRGGQALNGAKIMAVVKSEAYGHGMILVARIVEKEIDWFATVSGEEALQLRKAGIKKPILVLSFYSESEIFDCVKHKISLVVYDLKQAKLISQAAKKLKAIANVHLKIDTGTSRIGIKPKEMANFARQIFKMPNLNIEGVFSHLAASEENLEFTKKQIHLFDNVVEELEWQGIDPIKHLACTAAGIVTPKARLDMVRLGIGLYGLWPSKEAQKQAKFALKPALSWQTRIIQVKTVAKGTFVSYGLTFQTKKETTIAVLPIGYFDGFDRGLGNRGVVLIHDKRCKVLGRVCMNLTMVDVTDIKNIKAGDVAVLIGKQGKEEITADEIAKKLGTINYEVVSRINPLINRKLI